MVGTALRALLTLSARRLMTAILTRTSKMMPQTELFKYMYNFVQCSSPDIGVYSSLTPGRIFSKEIYLFGSFSNGEERRGIGEKKGETERKRGKREEKEKTGGRGLKRLFSYLGKFPAIHNLVLEKFSKRGKGDIFEA